MLRSCGKEKVTTSHFLVVSKKKEKTLLEQDLFKSSL